MEAGIPRHTFSLVLRALSGSLFLLGWWVFWTLQNLLELLFRDDVVHEWHLIVKIDSLISLLVFLDWYLQDIPSQQLVMEDSNWLSVPNLDVLEVKG